ncbi:transcription antitermination factor NusB [Desulfonatronovibrio magnus]|uniref:transcription antitermination factor NusB n=1 Tax=Desulfonatronovibrio magnus TaxID=698827 RepID=UPI0005EB83F1|nr:transcription antitermination factor NusB [Desulfonatronovibrio magnus]
MHNASPSRNPRVTALKVVSQCLHMNMALQKALDQELLKIADQRDKGFVTELVYGSLRHKGRLDYMINSLLQQPDKLPAKVRLILVLAGYELFYMDRVPHYATLSSFVHLCKNIFGRKMASLVNAVLRKLAHEDLFDQQNFQKDNPSQLEFWSRYYSCPLWIVKMWKKDYGADACLEYLKQSLEQPPLSVREDSDCQGILNLEEYIMDRKGSSVLLKPDYPDVEQYIRKGKVYRQSFAGQLAMHKAGMSRWENPVWDMCAGSGGKSMLMLNHDKRVFSSDVHFKRLKNLKEQCVLNGRKLSVFTADGDCPPLRIMPGTVLIDAPCSGLGVLSRRPDIKWKRRIADVRKLAMTQKILLQSAARVTTDNGRVVYITCTLSRKENEIQINDFLYKFKHFQLEDMFSTDTALDLKESFFAAVLRKSG